MRVRIIRNWSWPDLLQQTPDHSGIWDDVRFSEEETDDADFCVVLNNPGPGQTIPYPPERVVRVVQEPPIEFLLNWHDHPPYSSLTFTCDPLRRGPEYRRSHPMVPWHINRDYDFLAYATLPMKSAALSWITSTKSLLAGHRRRLDFLHAIRGRIPELELVAPRIHHIADPEARRRNTEAQQALGFSFVADKWAGLAPYKYSLAVENFSGPDYWTEKLADCFLSWTLPFYYGCPNLTEYFPPESFIPIDIAHPDEAIETIRRTLRDDPYEKRLAALTRARQLVLDTHQMFPTLARHFRAGAPHARGHE